MTQSNSDEPAPSSWSVSGAMAAGSSAVHMLGSYFHLRPGEQERDERPIKPADGSSDTSERRGSLDRRHRKSSGDGLRRKGGQMDEWDKKLQQFSVLTEMEKATGISKVYLALLALIAAGAVIFWGFGMSVLTTCVGFAYPMYASFKAMERRHEHPSKIKTWLAYWTILSAFFTLETVLDQILQFVPLHNLLKIFFLVYLQMPGYKGSRVIYYRIVRPLLSPFMEDIVVAGDTVSRAASFTVSRMERSIKDKGRRVSQKMQRSKSD